MRYGYKPFPELRTRRESLEMSQREFAKYVGISLDTLRHAEQGKVVSPDTYRWIEEALSAKIS